MLSEPRFSRPTGGQARSYFCPWHAHWISSFSLADGQPLDSQRNFSTIRQHRKRPKSKQKQKQQQQSDDRAADLSVYRRDYRPEKYGRPFVYPPMRDTSRLLMDASWSSSIDQTDGGSVSQTSYAAYDRGLVQNQKLANDAVARLTSRSMQNGSGNGGGGSWLQHHDLPVLRMQHQAVGHPSRLPPLLNSSTVPRTVNETGSCNKPPAVGVRFQLLD
uniref:Uncharacterized protein n=1 Tax=Macrostomum lignano TaxID=282301 RepID=A0A1I8HBQ9_9PLAT